MGEIVAGLERDRIPEVRSLDALACDRTQYGEGWLKMMAKLTIFPSLRAK
jgi:hypothetical protein